MTYNPILHPVIKTVISCDNFGISKHGIRAVAYDRTTLLLEIPYAMRILKWEVHFLEDNLAFAPDFIFEEDFLEDPGDDVLEQHVRALSTWNVEDSDALLNVVKQFLDLYTKQQLRVLTDDGRFTQIYSEYRELLQSDNDIKASNVEMSVYRGFVHIYIAIDVDFSKLPPYSFPLVFSEIMDVTENMAYLHIGIDANYNARRCLSNLQLSPQVEVVLGGSAALGLPVFTVDTSLAHYVAQVQILLQEKVSTIVDHYHKKMDFILKLLALDNIIVLEYDVSKFEQVSFLVGEGNDVAQVIISIDAAFPKERPKVKVFSIYQQEVNGKPKYVNVHSYVYNSKLSTPEMINNIMSKLQETMRNFK